MKYSISDTINRTRQHVIDALLNIEQLKKWQPTLVRVESTVGQLFNKGSSGYQIYDGAGFKSKLKVSVPSSQLPDSITLVYEIPDVINTCVYRFQEINGVTHYHMEVTFEFADGIERDEAVFKAGTRAMMEPLKRYLEQE